MKRASLRTKIRYQGYEAILKRVLAIVIQINPTPESIIFPTIYLNPKYEQYLIYHNPKFKEFRLNFKIKKGIKDIEIEGKEYSLW